MAHHWNHKRSRSPRWHPLDLDRAPPPLRLSGVQRPVSALEGTGFEKSSFDIPKTHRPPLGHNDFYDDLQGEHQLGWGYLHQSGSFRILCQPPQKPGDWISPAAHTFSAVRTSAEPTNVTSCSSTSTSPAAVAEGQPHSATPVAELLHSRAQWPSLPHFLHLVRLLRSSISFRKDFRCEPIVPEAVDFVKLRAWFVLAVSVLPSESSMASRSCVPEWSARKACTSSYWSSSDSASRGLLSSTAGTDRLLGLRPSFVHRKAWPEGLAQALMMAFCSSLSPAQFSVIQPRAGPGKSVFARRLHLSNVSHGLELSIVWLSHLLWPTEQKASPSASPIRSVASFSGNLSPSTFHNSLSPPSTARLSNVRCSTASQAAPSNKV